MGSIVELRLLGPVELVGPDGLVRLGGPHRRAIVAQLALHEGRTVTTGELIDGLWGDGAPASVRKSLSTQVAQVRRVLATAGARLEHTGGGYRLDLPPGWLDLSRFEQAEREAVDLTAAGLTERAIERLRDALDCWQGPPLADLGQFPFAAAAVGWLLPRRHAAEDRLAELLLAAGQPDDAVLLLERLVEDSPYDERRWAVLVRALNAGGRRRDALLAYQRAREQLGEGIGLDPGRELRQAERDVLAGGPVGAGGATPETTRSSVPFVGRAVELDRLERALERAERGAMQAVAVLGEPGIGRSRLLRELVRRLRSRGVTVLFGGCEPSQAVPLQSLLAALEPVLTDPVGAGVGGVDPDLLHLLRGPPTPPSLVDPNGLDLRRYRVIGALSRTIANLAATGPVALVFDDIHWLDPFTAAALDHLCTAHADLPVLFVAGASTANATWSEVEERLVRFERAVPLERVRMRPLSSAEVQALVRGQAVGVQDVDLLVEQIQEASGGNALYATQLAGAAAAAGRLPTTLPDGLDAMCRSRVASMSPEARALLDAGGVLGMDLRLSVVAAMLDVSVEAVEEQIQEVLAAGLLTESQKIDHHRFAHGVIRQLVYDDLPPGRRRRLHAKAADAVRAVGGADDPTTIATVAHHLRHAQGLVSDDRLRDALEAAGRQAARQGALEAGQKLLEEALGLTTGEEERASIDIAIGIIAMALGDRAGAPRLEAGADLARAHDRWDLAAEAAIALAQSESSPSDRRSLARAAELEDILEHLDDADLSRRALLQSWRAYLLVNVDAPRSLLAIEAAEALAAGAANPPTQVAVRYVRLRQAESRGDDPAACVHEALQLAADAAHSGDPGLASYGHVACQAARLRAGWYDACRAEQPGYLQHAVDRHQRAIELQLVAVDVALQFATGTVGKIEAASLALHDRLAGSGVDAAPMVRFIQQLFTEREGGARTTWARALAQVADGAPRGAEPFMAAGLLSTGEEEAARDTLVRFLGRLGALRQSWSRDAQLAVAAEVASDLALAGPHVAELYDALLPSRGQVVVLSSVVVVLGRTDRYLGRLAHLAGDAELAIEHLALARRLDDAARSGLWSGWAARDEAMVRLERGAPGDREVAAELLDLALARGRSHGSERLTSAASI